MTTVQTIIPTKLKDGMLLFHGSYTAVEKINLGMLMPDNLDDQFCFLTEHSIHCLEFQEARKYVI